MAPSEVHELREIRALIEGHIADFRVFKTKLMGDDELEDDQGRIPRIEASIDNHNNRIVRVEKSQTLARAVVILFCAVSAVAELWYHVVEATRR
jgi:hypothetical protein